MTPLRLTALCTVAAATMLTAFQGFAQGPQLPGAQPTQIQQPAIEPGDPPPPPPGDIAGGSELQAEMQEGVEVYNRGQLHEAFATPTMNDPVERPVIDQQPPEPIDEVPPQEAPEGANILWVPGYWSYDEQAADFIWISGLWRDAPPGRTWVPGYWVEAQGGWRWISGAWVDEQQEEISYVPVPPPSQERGPSSPAPGDGYFWVPGHWEFVEVQHRWHPGYWAPHRHDWIWVPASYVWTPRGCVFVPGYWDYVVAYRGLCYAPVYFHEHHHPRPFTPTVVLNSWDRLTLHLFVRNDWGSYYFGDYYGPSYNHYTPFYAHHQRRGYDPIFVYYNWRFGDVYGQRLQNWHQHFVSHEDHRPRRTLREERQFLARAENRAIAQVTQVAVSVNELQRDQTPVRFHRLDEQQQRRMAEHAREVREFTRERSRVEVALNGNRGRDPEAGRPEQRPGQPDDPRVRSDARLRIQKPFAGIRTESNVSVEVPERPENLRGALPDSREGEPDRSRGPRGPIGRDAEREEPGPGRGRPEMRDDEPRGPGREIVIPGRGRVDVPEGEDRTPGRVPGTRPGEREMPRDSAIPLPGERPGAPPQNDLLPGERPNLPGERPDLPGQRPDIPGERPDSSRGRMIPNRPDLPPGVDGLENRGETPRGAFPFNPRGERPSGDDPRGIPGSPGDYRNRSRSFGEPPDLTPPTVTPGQIPGRATPIPRPGTREPDADDVRPQPRMRPPVPNPDGRSVTPRPSRPERVIPSRPQRENPQPKPPKTERPPKPDKDDDKDDD